MSAESYEYTYSSGGSLGGGYTVTEYSNSGSGSSGANVLVSSSELLGSSGAALLGGSSGYSNETVYISSSGVASGSAGVSFGSLSGSAGATLSASSGSAGGSNAVVNQVAQDLLALGAGAGSSQSIGFSGAGSSQSVGFSGAGAFGGLESSAFSRIEQAILSASNPIDINESEVITVNGESGIWSNKQEVINWRGVIPITQYLINQDQNPEIIRKRTEQQLIYDQEIAIRYLRPPTPPPPGEILIKQEKNIVTPPAPPLVIRQQPPRPETPPPMVVREAPPRPPAAVGQKVITISGKRLPPPPRKVVIERLAPLPSKPQSVIIERWLPYKDNKRRVIFTRPTEPDPVIPRPRNVIVQWEAPQVVIKKEFRDLGVIRANPVEYVQRYGASLKSHVELPQFVKEIRPPTGVVLAAEHVASAVYDLEGDVQALSLIDLDREGLSEYRSFVRQFVSGGSAGGFSGSLSSSSYSGSGNLAFGQAGGNLSGGSVLVSSGSSGYEAGYTAGGSGTLFLGSGSSSFESGFAGFGSGSSSSGSGALFLGSGSSVSGVSSLNALLAELFASVDTNSSGKISRSEAQSLLLKLNSRLGRTYGEDELKVFFHSLDVNLDGQIDFEEFRRALLKQF